MTMQDPISDLLTRVRNGQSRKRNDVSMPASKTKQAIAKVLTEEGYIKGFDVKDVDGKPTLTIELKYHEGKPVISEIKRVSRPGLRTYKGKSNLPKVLDGLGVAIVSTSKGVMTDYAARQMGEGGEILCYVW